LTQAARSGGKGTIVGVVDAYGYPSAASDLAVYRRNMGLPSCVAGCLKVVNQNGRSSPLPKPNVDPSDDWRPEEALDLDMVSAVCPNCRIILVQANSNKNADLAAALNTAVALGASAISNSYSGKEENARDGAYQHGGRAITASAGEGGIGTRAPCSYAGVVCVGGTSLVVASSRRGWTERAWRDAASGCSTVVGKPSWQHVRSCKMRSEVDVSAVADPATGVAVYESAAGGWQQMGGTGVGTAIVAALFALGSSAGRANAPQWIWRHGGGAAYHHVGSARAGYDGPTGWGTPNGIGGF
jgi:subtilase family serine protease